LNIYANAEEWEDAAKDMLNLGKYRMAVINCCFASELYIKSVADRIAPAAVANSHDILGIYRNVAAIFLHIDAAYLFRARQSVTRLYYWLKRVFDFA